MSINSSRDGQMRTFVAVGRASSLREAAEILNLTSAALSKQVRSFEALIGKQLFLRHGRGMRLTSDGQSLFLKIEPLLEALDAAVSNSANDIFCRGGNLRIATVQTLAPYFIPYLSSHFSERFPNTQITIYSASSTGVVESVERGKVDIGFVYEVAVDTPKMRSDYLFDESFALFAQADVDISNITEEVFRKQLILPPKNYALRRIIERFLEKPTQPFIECNSLELCLRLVASTAGITILPSDLPADMVEMCGIQRKSLTLIKPRRIVAISRLSRKQSPGIDAALEIAKEFGRQRASTSS